MEQAGINDITPEVTTVRKPAILRWPAQLISYVFHPLFIPVYVTSFIVFKYPYLFSGLGNKEQIRIIISIFINLSFFPALVVFLLWRLKFSSSIMLRTQKERIIPYVACLTFYFWAWYVLKSQPEIPRVLVQFVFGSFLAVCVAWMANIFVKISMHTIAAGGMAAFMLLIAFNGDMAMGVYLSVAILIAGLVATSRLLVSDHSYFEIYTGLIGGILSQVVAAWIME